MLQTETIHPSDLTPELISAWRRLCASQPAFASPLLGPDFAVAVGAVRDDARVTVGWSACKAVLFFPHHARPGGLIRPIGAPFSDYQAVVADPAVPFSPRELLAAAGADRFLFEGLIDPQRRFSAHVSGERRVYGVQLDGTADAYFQALRAESAKRFKNMRRLEHKLEREVGDIRLVAPDHDPGAFSRLLAWKSEQFARTGLHDVLAPDWVSTLMRRFFETREGPLTGMMVILRAGGRPVAGHFGVRAGQVFHPWVAAFDPEFAPYGPGVTLVSRAIRAMTALGLTRYDLSGGHDHYKRPFTIGTETVAQGMVSKGGGRASKRRFAERPSALVRLGRRLDHIAAVEPTLPGRVRGVLTALRGASLRLAGGAAE